MSYRDWFPNGQEDWFGQKDGGEGEDNRPPQRPKIKLPVSKPLAIIIGLVVLAFILVQTSAGFLTEFYWFQARELLSVFWTRILPQWGLLAIAASVAFVLLWGNYKYARTRSNRIDLPDEVSRVMPLRSPFAWIIVIAAAAVLAFISGNGVRGQWEIALRFIYGTSFGTTDPIFGNDIGFYVFSMPFYGLLQRWLLQVLFLCLAGSGVIYTLTLLPKFQIEKKMDIPEPIKAHVLSLGSMMALVWAFGYWLERFNLLYSSRGVAFGASYTDIHADLLALNVMTVLSVIVAVLLIVGIKKKTWKFSAAVVGTLVVAGILLRGVYPGLIQKYVVEPNEFDKEKPYIEYNIDATTKAYGLEDLKVISVVPDSELTRTDLDKDPETLRNIRLWAFRPLLRSYKQLQEIRSYYGFNNVDIDRYDIDGHYRQVMLSARELNLAELQNPTWINTKLEFTHGYGAVMNPVNEVSPSGQPVLWIKDLPPVIGVSIDINRPQIYFGETPEHYVFVKTSVEEFDYPMGESNMRTTYDGKGGVPCGSIWRRLVYSLGFNDSKILFTDVFKKDSRVMYHKNIKERLNKVAPFLMYDGDPYLAIIDGKFSWIQDCYTAIGGYPYSEPVVISTGEGRKRINYIRNSVKATIDAYDGTMKFYVMDEKDPIINTWRKIFPAIFTDKSEMPSELKKHIRYPKGLFSIQSEIYRTYHMQNPNTFYNKEDVWETSSTGDKNSELNSYYLIMTLVGEEKPEFALISPFMPVGKNNMISWLAGRCDGDNYGQLWVYKFPKQKLIYGPTQVEALVDQDPEISSELSLWSQRGSDVIRGSMLVIPVGNSLLYVQPLYLKADIGDLPELKRVIVSTGGRVAWAKDFGTALAKLLGKTGTLTPDKEAVTKQRVDGTPGTDIYSLAKQAQNRWDASQEALRSGNWEEYGKQMNELESILADMMNKADVKDEELPEVPELNLLEPSLDITE